MRIVAVRVNPGVRQAFCQPLASSAVDWFVGTQAATSLELLDRIDAIRLGRWIYGNIAIDEGQTHLS